jgi:hypothetical protein
MTEKVVKWLRRRPAVAALLATVALVTMLGVAGFVWKYRQANFEKRLALEQKAIAQEETLRAEAATRQVEEALLESQRRLTLNYFAYGRLCAVAAQLATASNWEDAEQSRREFQNLVKAINLLGDESVKPTLREFTEALARWRSDEPPAELKQLSLDLAKACRKPWTDLIDRECRELADQVRGLLYERAVTAVEEIIAAASWEKAVGARQEFEELYWGELVMVESEEVEAVMVRLGEVIRAWDRGIPPRSQLRRLTGELRKACRLQTNKGGRSTGRSSRRTTR